MYPYFYPSYYGQPKTGTPGMMPSQPIDTNMPQGAGPMQQGPMGPMGPMMGQPTAPEIPPTPGTTSGLPVESVPPAQPYIGPPQVSLGAEPGTPVIADTSYTQGFLRTQIGKKVRIEFLIGTNSTTDRMGTLVDVGISYVLLRLSETDDILMGDLYAIKFVTIFA